MALTDGDLKSIKELVVDPLGEKFDRMEKSVQAQNDAQDARITAQGVRVDKLEKNQTRALGALAAVVVGVQISWKWVGSKTGWW